MVLIGVGNIFQVWKFDHFLKMVVWWVENILGKNGGEVLILRSHLSPPQKKTIAADVG